MFSSLGNYLSTINVTHTNSLHSNTPIGALTRQIGPVQSPYINFYTDFLSTSVDRLGIRV
jgi:hypothetical protein